jgi:hypothetical protein
MATVTTHTHLLSLGFLELDSTLAQYDEVGNLGGFATLGQANQGF